MSREVLERDLDAAGKIVFGLRTAVDPSDAVRFDQLGGAYTFQQGVTLTGSVVTGDYITGKAGAQVWTGGINTNDSLTIRASSNAQPGPMTLTESQLVVNLVPATLAQATSAVLDAVTFNAYTLQISGTGSITTATGLNYMVLPKPVYNSASAITVTNAATLVIKGSPTYTGSATITNRYALWVQSEGIRIDGTDDQLVAIALNRFGEQDISKKSGILGIGTIDAWNIGLFTSNQTRVSLTAAGNIVFSNYNSLGIASGNGVIYRMDQAVTAGASATLDNVLYDASTIAISGGTTIATAAGFNQVVFKAPTYNGAVTVTNAATMTVTAAPSGTATITNPYALWVQAGRTFLAGDLRISSLGGMLKATAGVVGVGAAGTDFVAPTTTLTAGAGLTGGGDLTANRTFDVVANADGSIVVNANDIQVGVLATDAQHGVRGGGTQHAAATTSVAGFLSAADKSTLANSTFVVRSSTNAPASAQNLGILANGILKQTVSASLSTLAIAAAGTDYQAPLTAADTTISFPTSTTIKVNQLSNKFIVQGTADAMLTGAQFLGALATGLVKNTTTTGVLSIAVGGTDYQVPLTFSTGLTNNSNTITANLSTGVSGGQTAIGGTASGNDLTLSSTSNATKGRILNGTWFALDEVNQRVLIGTQTAGVGAPLTINTVDGGGNLRAIHLTRAGEQDVIKTGGAFFLGTSDANNLSFGTNNQTRAFINPSGNFALSNHGSLTIFTGNGFVVGQDQTVTSGASATLDNILFDTSTVTLTGSTAITTAGGFNQFTLKAPTITGGSAITITKSATLAVSGAPATGGSVTITNRYALWVQNGALAISGVNAATQAIVLDRAGEQDIIKSGGLFVLGTSDANDISVLATNVVRLKLTSAGNLVVTNRSSLGTINTGFRFGYDATVASASGATLDLVQIDPSTVTVTGSTAITNSSGFNLVGIKAPTITDGSAVTISRVATVAIAGAPIAGGSVSFTKPHALWLQNGSLGISGGDASLRAIYLDRSGEQDIIKTGGSFVVGTDDNQNFLLATSNVGRILINGSGQKILTNRSSAGSVLTGNGIVCRYDTTVPSATGNYLDSTISFDSGTVQVTGTSSPNALSWMTINAPTYNNASSMTVGILATVSITGPPFVTGSLAYTRRYALHVMAGVARFDGGEQNFSGIDVFEVPAFTPYTSYTETDDYIPVWVSGVGRKYIKLHNLFFG